MKIAIIVAVGKNNEIGKDNQLLWHLSADLKRFKELTTGHAIIMGRNTFESLPKGALPNRTNVVLSRNKNFAPSNTLVFDSLDAALVHLSNEEVVFIIGGADLYKQTIALADTLYLTKVHAEFTDADTFFPTFDRSQWKLLGQETVPADEKNLYASTFYHLER